MYSLFLSGPPGAGKSTFVREQLPSHFITLSLDNIVFREADRAGKTYEEIWKDYIVTAEELFDEQLKQCLNRRLDFIIDKTHLDEKSRKKTLMKIGSDVKKIAIYFPAYTPEVLVSRMEKRAKEGGHMVPLDVVQSMHQRYRLPQKTEGFDLVVSASHFIDIMKVMEFR
jgi:predicted kinase